MRFRLLFILVFGFYFNSNAQWKRVYIPTVKDLYDVQIIENIGYSVGNSSALLKSYDTGKSWKNLTLTVPTNLRAIHFIDTSMGFVIGENARIQKTMDGGKSWTQKYVRTAAYGYDITFQNNHGIAVGKDMLIVSSIDYGENWTVDTTFKQFKKLNSVTILPDGNCWAVGDSGYILNKNINSKKWKISKYPTKVDLNHVSHVAGNTIIIVGGMPDTATVGKFYNILLLSIDTGKTWQQNSIGEMKIINSAWYFNEDTGILVGSNGLISQCTNGVSDRGLQITGTPSSLNQVTFSNEIGVVVGDGGILLRTNNRGGKVLSNNEVFKSINNVSITPNPGLGEFALNSEIEISHVRIFNAEGKLVHTDDAYKNGKIIVLEQTGCFSILATSREGKMTVNKLLILAN